MALRPRNILSLCAGVGGLELGILLALRHRGEDGRGICYVEGEVAAAASLVASMEAGWFHPAPVWSDMRTFDAQPWHGFVHILASGDPCQENSVAGKRAGAAGARFLAPEVCRIAAECRPDIVFRENVPGNADGQLAAIVPPLERLGYRIAAGIFSSAETGNTMRRERLFIMAVADGGSGGDRRLQCRRELRLLPKGDGACGRNDIALAQPEGVRPREGWSEHAGQQGRCAVAGASSAMGSTIGCGDGRIPTDAGRGSIERVAADGSGDGRLETMGSASSAEPQGQQRGQHHALGRQVKGGHPLVPGRAVLPPAVIPGPTDSRWIDVLDRFPELQPALSEEEAQSHLRRGIDTMAHRVERLRATGNGVDPITAAYAFLSLSALLRDMVHDPVAISASDAGWTTPRR